MVGGASIVFVSGLGVMVLELVAGRLVAPYFGQSTCTWAALTGVTLAGVTVGNALGGWLAAKMRRPNAVAAVALAVGGLLIAALPFALPALSMVLAPIEGFEARTAAFVATAWLPPMLVLGCVTPSIAAACVRAESNGRDLGTLYFGSMIGSALGSTLGGLVLPFVWPADMLYLGFGIILLVAAVFAFLIKANVSKASQATSATGDAASTTSEVKPLWLFLAVFAVGWFGMGIELAGAKLVMPILGGNHIVWSLIFITFIGTMGVGGWAGGRIADRLPRIETVVYALLALAVFGFATVWMETRLLPSLLCEAGAIARLVLFTVIAFLPLGLVLGGASTILLKFATADALKRGNTSIVGFMYATASAGSVCGTFVTGFALVGRVTSTDLCIGLVAVLAAVVFGLAIMSGARCDKNRHIFWPAAVFAGLATLWLGGKVFIGHTWADLFTSLQTPLEVRNDEGWKLLSVAESRYNVVTVSALADNPDVRTIWLDRIPHTTVNIRDRLHLNTSYTRMLDAVAMDVIKDNPSPSLFMIGGGGYALPRKWARGDIQWSKLVVAEIDGAVTAAAVKYLDAAPAVTNGVEYIEGDGRRVVDDLLADGAAGRFDVVVGDTISDAAIPYHLATKEFNERLKTMLKPDGVYLIHVLDTLDSPSLLTSILKTTMQTWKHATAITYQQIGDVRQSFVVVASDDPAKADAQRYADIVAAAYPESYPLAIDETKARSMIADCADAIMFTDRFAPMETFVWDVVFKAADKRAERIAEDAAELLKTGKSNEALALVREVLAIAPELPSAIKVLRSYIDECPDDGDAVGLLKEQSMRKSAGWVAQSAYASWLAVNGDNAGAEEVLGSLMARFPGRLDFAQGWMMNAAKCGKREEALAWLEAHKQKFGQFEYQSIKAQLGKDGE